MNFVRIIRDENRLPVAWALASRREARQHHPSLPSSVQALSAFFVRGGFNGTLFPLWAEARFGLDPAFVGLLLTIAAGAGLLTMLASGRIADRVGRKGPLMASLLLTGLILPFVFFAPTLSALSLTMVLHGLAIGFHGPIAAWAADLAPGGGVGTAMGVYRSVADLGWVAGPLVFFHRLLLPARDPVGQGRAPAPVTANGGSQGSGGGGST